MAYTLPESIQREIERTFAPEDVEYVRSQLAGRELPFERSGPVPRVHIAVLWLSKGDRKRFDYELQGACCDWRDTLVAAGLENEDWREILRKKGVDCRDW